MKSQEKQPTRYMLLRDNEAPSFYTFPGWQMQQPQRIYDSVVSTPNLTESLNAICGWADAQLGMITNYEYIKCVLPSINRAVHNAKAIIKSSRRMAEMKLYDAELLMLIKIFPLVELKRIYIAELNRPASHE